MPDISILTFPTLLPSIVATRTWIEQSAGEGLRAEEEAPGQFPLGSAGLPPGHCATAWQPVTINSVKVINKQVLFRKAISSYILCIFGTALAAGALGSQRCRGRPLLALFSLMEQYQSGVKPPHSKRFAIL
jgi:hypothetical protein